MIGTDITVKVLGVRSGQVKLGIEAPRDLPVHREEIYERIRAENARGTDEEYSDDSQTSACGR